MPSTIRVAAELIVALPTNQLLAANLRFLLECPFEPLTLWEVGLLKSQFRVVEEKLLPLGIALGPIQHHLP